LLHVEIRYADEQSQQVREIVFVCGQWLDDSGGGKKVISFILAELAKRGDFHLSLVDFESRRRALSSEDKSSIQLPSQVDYHPIFSPLFKQNPYMFLPFSRLLSRIDPDVIVDATGPKLKIWNILFAKKVFGLKAKYVLFDHSPLEPLMENARFGSLRKRVARFSYHCADSVGSVSEELALDTMRRFGLDRKDVFWISNPFDVEGISRLSKAPAELERYQPYVVSVGRLDPFQKDFPLLVRAFSEAQIDARTKLLILGEGPQKDDLLKLVKTLGMEKRVFLVGYQANPYPFYAGSECFVLSTKFESFGMVLVEALACGVPVISADCDFGPREILDGGVFGLLVTPGSVPELKTAIEQMCNDGELNDSFRRKSRSRASHYDSKRIMEQYAELLS
jgi:glycosyltransferase involved in cell wall biosynthesis